MAKSNFIKDNQSIIIGAVAIYFGYNSIIKPLLETLGISKSQAEININQESINPGSAWNPNYWKRQMPATILTDNAANNFVNTIWNSVGWFSDNFDSVLGVFKQLKTKSQVSYLVDKFNQAHQKDLLNWLLGGSGWSYPADRFSADQVKILVDYVNSLKNY